MSGFLRFAWLLPGGLWLLVWPAGAQVRVGDLSSSLSGTISTGYTADYGNMTGSDHSWTVGGTANLAGSFYTPNFLSYNASVYLNQSRANSDFQSISNASGVNATTSIFGGSRFPGSITYSKAYDSEGNYAVPGLANYVTHGNSDTFGVNWSENLPDAPSFTAGFQLGTSQYSVYGTDDNGKNSFHSLNLHSAYRIEDIDVGAFYSNGGSHAVIPELLAGNQTTESNSGNSAYGFNMARKLPLQGSVSGTVNRTSWNTDYLGTNSTGTIDLFNALAAVHPTQKVAFSASANYSDNLSGQLIQSIIASGSPVPGLNFNQASNSLDLMGVASYSPALNLQTSAFAERRTQLFLGETYGVKSYGGSISYAHELFDGSFNTSATASANTSDNSGEDTLGFSMNENYSNTILGWHITEMFGYAQNSQTLLVTYLNSFYNFSGNVRRNWGQFNLSFGAGGARTALTQQAGTSNSSQSYNASLGYAGWFTATGSYSKADGQALATGAGLVPVPVPTPILPSSLVTLFGGNSYSFGLSSTPIKKLVIAGTFARSSSNTSGDGVASANQNEEANVLIQYQYRKLSFISGYARLEQGFSNTGSAPEVLSSFYIGVSRWFNFF